MNTADHIAQHDDAIKRLAIKIAQGNADLVEDLYQTGMLVLIQKHQGSYDHDRESTLLTYAVREIKKQMYRVRDRQWPVEEIMTDPCALPRFW